ncbi:hypothetical protein [Saccharopolyspora mangrovi]|uniref:Uncharacterized protein n=1 Tax=Saccharopolyspora mangrovi TaxID=3082379 RepID=A0ABU6AJT0_9PSEU|nr:hypothetical protein [Saccharopolyspora sp. S2-29]MEB3371639.1 hypothetical protein [Saccharopolyspora sp. S2-29]
MADVKSVAAPLSQRSRSGTERIESVEPGVPKILVTSGRFVNLPLPAGPSRTHRTSNFLRRSDPEHPGESIFPEFHRKR